MSELSKQELIDAILKLVNKEQVDGNGRKFKPNNPFVFKTDIARDEDGEPLYRVKDGAKYPIKKTILDDDGNPLLEPRYTYEKLHKARQDYLENLYFVLSRIGE